MTPETTSPAPRDLTRFAWLSIATAILTIALKAGAWYITGSVGLLSDAAESLVNLVAAVFALIALRVAARPADKSHHFGHSKAEYFSAAGEGVMIFVAAVFIIVTAVERLLSPTPIDNVGAGLAVSVVASILNGATAMVLLRAGRAHRSKTLQADGKHLLADVWTTVGVLVGVGLVALTGWHRLDPIVALLVGVNIIVTGWKLVTESAEGLMDVSWPKQDNADLARLMRRFTGDEVDIHALRTRESGHQRYCDFHLLVPGAWTVDRAHDLCEEIEAAVKQAFDGVVVTGHIEPREDPRSYSDYEAEVALPEY
ncbi:cation diffusion facilitator family transporter [Mobilicoccus pelagius]|uniref:Putative cation efflux protein n=1 Tax=Mobilicoccus pelagius NBRC 104925 TaxID=1089455 RepID=H5UPC8_9MICO|nr:cation diffusion facilitator family transporter [Mobilicoccus pelagius]GAB47586.1 putative cation efflux protein [Mobilicoccus pelagius NBRC 104925]